MIVCKNKHDYRILQSLRAHGWDREYTKNKKTFNFVNQGFNLRPLETSAAIALSQFKRIDSNMVGDSTYKVLGSPVLPPTVIETKSTK